MASATSAAFKLHCVDHSFENPVKTDIPTVFTINFKFDELESLASLST